MAYKTFETENYILKIHDDEDFLEYTIRDGCVIDDKLAKEVRSVVVSCRPGVKFYTFVECEGFFRVTKKARALAASKAFSSHLAAVAFFSTNVSLTLLGVMYNKINKPAVITRTFMDRNIALEWLRAQMNNPGELSQGA